MRRNLDAYYTPTSAVNTLKRSLYKDLRFDDWVLEPCCGTKNIAKEFHYCITADIDPSVEPLLTLDMSKAESWKYVSTVYGPLDWIITNPPFSHALEIAELGLQNCKKGMALLLRLSFLEPTYKRQDWLSQHPPNQLIVLPRISFTGDGKHDSVTCAWMIWNKSGELVDFPISIQKKD